jgi:nucleoside-diphosphate-sugar epimerase
MPTRNLLSALARVHPGLTRFVFVSSSSVYGPSPPGAPRRESDPRRPIEHYGKSKLEAEEAVEASGVPWTIVRPAAVYGPGDVDFFNLFQSAMYGINAFFGNRDRSMSMIYVDDCVRGIVDAAAHQNTGHKGYFLATHESVTWEGFQDEVVRAVGRKVQTIDFPEQLLSLAALGGEIASRIDRKPRLLNLQKVKMGKQDAWTCSAEAARADFGFEGQVALAEGVRRTHEWYAAEGWYRGSKPGSASLSGFVGGVGPER